MTMALPTSDPTDPPERRGSFRWPVLALALLTFTAGYADGYSLSQFDVFIANQSGNIVRAGMGVFGEYSEWRLALLSILGFAVGAGLSWSVPVPSVRFGWTVLRIRLLVASVFLAAWWLLALVGGDTSNTGVAAALLGAMALGILASAMTSVAGTPVQPTFQTGTVLNGARGLVLWAAGDATASRAGRRLVVLGALMILIYALGGAAGALATRTGATALLIGLLLPVAALLMTRPAPATPA
jgi:uncharacterized membrane protein YoaK (UPF0700 family)